ncbi:MAG: hypothetical protein IIB72_03855 [Proteobacteria bacterium]|nr:hypothetical protein [Pseudomonadota bacterium]
MLSKFLLTLAVIIAAFLVLRQRKLSTPPAAAKPRSNVDAGKGSNIEPKNDSLSADMRVAAYTFLVLMVGLGATMYYFRWQDDHHILTISLHRDNLSAPVIYQVYKFQLQDRSFVTIGGTVVNVASSERMEVSGLTD